MAKAWGRAQMARAMKRADAEASEVEIHGERYQRSGRGRVAVPARAQNVEWSSEPVEG